MNKLLKKRTILLMMLLRFCVYAQAQDNNDQRITLLAGNASLSSILKNIEHQTNKRFNYSEQEVNINEKVNVNYNEAPLNQVLGQLFSAKGISWRMIDDGIYLRKEDKPAALPAPKDSLQVFLLRGRVTDEDGQPLVGATILVRGTTTGAVADADGRFVLANVPHNAALRISFTSYEASEIVPGGRRNVDVVLKKKIGSLDETVVIGYGTTTKRFNTGAVSTVKADVIESQPVTDPLLALQGRVPGLYITQTSGLPGTNSTVMLRGKNSIANGNNPFYIIDGVPYTAQTTYNLALDGGALGTPPEEGKGASPFNFLTPSDIERIDVLKDADATAIYGSRGANGVILITTKKGKAGKTRLDINASTGAGKVVHMMELQNTSQYLKMRREAFVNDGKNPGPRDYDVNGTWDTTRYTDWQKIMIGGTAKLTNIQAAISGGSAKTQFALRTAYSNQTTVFPGDYADRKFSTLLSVTQASANDRFHATITASYLNEKNKLPQIDFTSLIALAPNSPALYDSTGQLNWANNTFTNPLASTKQFSQSTTDNLIGNVELNYEILPGLVIKSNFGYNKIQTNQTNQTPITALPPIFIDYSAGRSNNYGTTNLYSWIIEPQISYSKQIAKGNLTALIGTTLQQNNQDAISYYTSDYTNDAALNNIAMAKNIAVRGVNYTQYKYNAIFGRINYEWKEKYILNLTARRDGSSRFGPGKQFGNFGALGAAWIFSDENWVREHLNFLSYGKIRASYGTTGNDQISDYQYLSTYSSNYMNYQGLPGIAPTRIPNADFGWEEVRKMELGIETGFIQNRILLNIDFYRNRTNNQLVGFNLPGTTGFSSVQYNLPALVQNTGFEADLNTVNIQSRDFSWKTSANISLPRNKLLAYPENEQGTYFLYVVGKSILGRRLLEYTGVDPQTGLYTVKDVNNDGAITMTDYINYAVLTPEFHGGVLNSFNYKGIQLDIFFQFVKQHSSDYINQFSAMPGTFNVNFPADINDKTWHTKGEQAEYQKFSTRTAATANALNWRNSSNAVVTDASFIRLKNVMISYAIPNKILTKIRLSNLKIYLQGQNLLTFTSYKGLDPETRGALTLPPIRMIVGGIQVSL